MWWRPAWCCLKVGPLALVTLIKATWVRVEGQKTLTWSSVKENVGEASADDVDLVPDDRDPGMEFRFRNLSFDAPDVGWDVVGVDVDNEATTPVTVVVVVTPATYLNVAKVMKCCQITEMFLSYTTTHLDNIYYWASWGHSDATIHLKIKNNPQLI